MKNSIFPYLGCVTFVSFFVHIYGHGRLISPASRASLWRFPEFKKYEPLPDYDDTQSYCGGFHTQHVKNNGKCGVCGDPYDENQPRAHEGGGLYGKGIITGTYKAGQVMEAAIDLTANHLGYFEFRLCPQNNPRIPVTQECLNKNLLQLADGTGSKFAVTSYETGTYKINLTLPDSLTCKQCVLQWHYKTGNSHGFCNDGSYELGCGNQETFRSCADITIS